VTATQERKTRQSVKQPPVGVMAANVAIASSIAREMGIKNAVALSPKSNGARGMSLKSLVIDDSCWPLSAIEQANILPALQEYSGYIVRFIRYDPKKQGSLNAR
jgi:Asp/Glu/hydantoin racemase